MTARQDRSSRIKPLLGAAGLVLALLIGLMFVGGKDGFVACSPVAPAAESAMVAPATLDTSAPVVLADPSNQDVEVHAPAAGNAAPATLGDVAGLVIDVATGQPVPELDVQLSSGTSAESVRTENDGSFHSTRVFPKGRINAVISDDGAEIAHASTDHDTPGASSVWRIEVPIGPTYPITGIDGRPAVGHTWLARVVETTLPEGSAGEIAITPKELVLLAPSTDAPDRDWTWKPVRVASTTFVRWPKVAFAPDVRYRLRLEVKSTALTRKGDAKITGTVGIQPEVTASTQPFAEVEGTIDVPRDATRSDLHVLLLDAAIDADAASSPRPPLFDETTCTNNGYAFHEITPGPKRLVAWSPGFLVASTTFEAFPGPNVPPLLALSRPALKLGPWTHVVPDERSYVNYDQRHWLRLRLADAGRQGRAWLKNLERGDILLTDLPMGEYTIEAVAINGEPFFGHVLQRETLPSRSIGGGGGGGPAVRGERMPHAFEISDAQTSEPLESAAVVFGPSGAMLTTERPQRMHEGILLERGTPLSWSAWSDGYAPAIGDEGAFETQLQAAVARVRLVHGWGALLALRAGDPKEDAASAKKSERRKSNAEAGLMEAMAAQPLIGVDVLLDGLAAAATGPDGQALLVSRARPVRISLRCDGWVLSGLERIAGSGSRWFVWMKRR